MLLKYTVEKIDDVYVYDKDIIIIKFSFILTINHSQIMLDLEGVFKKTYIYIY